MLLQLKSLNAEVFRSLSASDGFPPPWEDMAQLEVVADDWLTQLREGRHGHAKNHGWLTVVRDRIDRKVLTDEVEYLDRPDIANETKVGIVRILHTMNVAILSYRRFLRTLRPLIDAAAARFGRSVRILELASGSGEFSLALSKLAKQKKLDVEVTGSDIVPTHVAEGARRAAERGLSTQFRVLNAFDLSDLASDAFDIVFIAQSIHHFSAGQLAMMVAQSKEIATTAFVGIDGYRGFPLLAFLAAVAAPTLNHSYFHDAVITSRRLYSEFELALIARLAVPNEPVQVKHRIPGLSVLTARFDGA